MTTGDLVKVLSAMDPEAEVWLDDPQEAFAYACEGAVATEGQVRLYGDGSRAHDVDEHGVVAD